MSSLRVVALISGGKDSFFSMLHCLEHGHRIVALANLYPEQQVDDLDSFMYQTIGHNVIPLYEQALGLPLYRRVITGRAISHGKTYERAADDDEVEALIPLLQQVMAEHPEVNAVSTGAILSDYQRTRVESVALRLGLVPLSYLWQYPRIVTRSPVALLEDMLAVRQDSRIIKVSSGGLDSSYLWDNVADVRVMRRLVKASQQFGLADDGAVLGEGGEYETLCLGGPPPLWKGRIVVDEEHRRVVPGEAGSSSLHITHAAVDTTAAAAAPAHQLSRPQLLEEHFQRVFDRLPDRGSTISTAAPSARSLAMPSCTTTRLDDLTICLGNWTATGGNIAEQTTNIMSTIMTKLNDHGHDSADIAYTSIVLRDMADFAAVNPAYAAAFSRPNPPARATIACAAVLPPGEHVSISVTSTKVDASRRQGLHVQSISYWAPANIGPYSQAITVPKTLAENSTTLTYIAGQIPLVPATMLLNNMTEGTEESRFMHQAVLSLQHLHRIARVTEVQAWQHAIAFITASDVQSLGSRAFIAECVWKEAHHSADAAIEIEEDDHDADFDVWHLQQMRGHAHGTEPKSTRTLNAVNLVVIRVDSLPRGADIEWVGFGASKHDPDFDVWHYRHLLSLFEAQVVQS